MFLVLQKPNHWPAFGSRFASSLKNIISPLLPIVAAGGWILDDYTEKWELKEIKKKMETRENKTFRKWNFSTRLCVHSQESKLGSARDWPVMINCFTSMNLNFLSWFCCRSVTLATWNRNLPCLGLLWLGDWGWKLLIPKEKAEVAVACYITQATQPHSSQGSK